MEFQPLKKIGEPVTFKGLRGPYLVNSLIQLGISILSVFLISMIPLGSSIQLGITGFIVLLFMGALKRNREKSKGDLHFDLKKKCRVKVNIRNR